MNESSVVPSVGADSTATQPVPQSSGQAAVDAPTLPTIALDAPLLAAWAQARTRRPAPFVIPGHKGSTALVGEVVAGDIALHGGMTSMRAAHAALEAAEQRAALLWGCDWARFSVGGSTHGNQALALAVGRPGDTVVVTRAAHRSLLLGLVLAGLNPVWVSPDVDPASGLPGRMPATRVAQALDTHPHAVGVFVVEPGYGGARSDVAALADVSHARGVPLIVDQAWAAHFGFHPALPPHALACGADAMVTSAHKSLPAYTQAALAFATTQRLDLARLNRGFDATLTTSPSGTIVASIDGARALLERGVQGELGAALDAVAAARQRLGQVPGVLLPDSDSFTHDPLRLAVGLAETGADGGRIEAELDERGFPVELGDLDTIVATVTMADSASTVEPFVDALISAIERGRGPGRQPHLFQLTPGEAAMSPREAFFSPHETVSWPQAVGRVSAEVIAPYPPGIAAVVPGEVLTNTVLSQLHKAAARGIRIAYAADPSLDTVQVLRF